VDHYRNSKKCHIYGTFRFQYTFTKITKVPRQIKVLALFHPHRKVKKCLVKLNLALFYTQITDEYVPKKWHISIFFLKSAIKMAHFQSKSAIKWHISIFLNSAIKWHIFNRKSEKKYRKRHISIFSISAILAHIESNSTIFW
jgi:hypothetical protein